MGFHAEIGETTQVLVTFLLMEQYDHKIRLAKGSAQISMLLSARNVPSEGTFRDLNINQTHNLCRSAEEDYRSSFAKVGHIRNMFAYRS
jgi:hypothetical protein